jgi:hypothetical protein
MSTGASDLCPRCGGGFHCGANDPAPCACTALKLDAATLAELRAQFKGCLCLNCLRDLAVAHEAATIGRNI